MAVLVVWQSRQLLLAVPVVDSLHTNSVLTMEKHITMAKHSTQWIMATKKNCKQLKLLTRPSNRKVGTCLQSHLQVVDRHYCHSDYK